MKYYRLDSYWTTWTTSDGEQFARDRIFEWSTIEGEEATVAVLNGTIAEFHHVCISALEIQNCIDENKLTGIEIPDVLACIESCFDDFGISAANAEILHMVAEGLRPCSITY